MNSMYLRGLAILAGALGRPEVAAAFNALAAAADAGSNIDSHMREVAEKLEAGVEPDWSDVSARIAAETDEFLSR